jgi:hypothetical protein
MKKGANRVLEEVKNAFSGSEQAPAPVAASPSKGTLTKSESGSLVCIFTTFLARITNPGLTAALILVAQNVAQGLRG